MYEDLSQLFHFAPVQVWRIKGFPRRGKKVRLRFMSRDSSGDYVTATEMTVKNPAPEKYGMWDPKPVPSRKEVGVLTVSLVGFETNLRRQSQAAGMFNWCWPDRVTTRAAFELEQEGREHHNWRLESLVLSDPTGNLWKPNLEDNVPAPPHQQTGWRIYQRALAQRTSLGASGRVRPAERILIRAGRSGGG